MKELSLFSGIGGGIYGSKILGWTTVAYVEKDKYCQDVLQQRIDDGWFDKGKIYGDIADFNRDYAHEYTGTVDILTGGFPCQPFSVAGKRKGTSDNRYLFDEIIKTIEIVQPKRLLFENVPGILNDRAIIEIYQSLNKIGYQPKPPLLLGSDDCDNIHRRKRVWIYADATSIGCCGRSSQKCDGQSQGEAIWSETKRCAVRAVYDTHTQCSRRGQVLCCQTPSRQESLCENETKTHNTCSRVSITSYEQLCKRSDIPKPLLCRMDDELPHWRKQLKAIGNGQDPIVMATAYLLLADL